MGGIDLFLDASFLILGIAGAVFVIVMRKRFDIWMSLLTCTAWVLKGVRLLCYDWYLITLEKMLSAGQVNDVFQLMQNVAIALQGVDTLVNLLLFAALGRLMLMGLFLRWYNRAQKVLGE